MLREYLKYVLKTEMIKGDFEEHQKESIVGKKENVGERTCIWDIQ